VKQAVFAFGLVLFLAFLVSRPAYADLTVSDLEKELMCQCGCTMVLEPCQCGTADQMRTLIGEMIDEGQTKSQILDYFVAQYGEKALSAPTKKGFNLIAWILPFAAIAAGGGIIYFILRTWVLKGKMLQEEAVPELHSWEDSDEYRRRFEQEFEQFRQEEDAR